MTTRATHGIKKTDTDLQIVWGEVYVPGFPDSQNEFMTTDEVRKMAHRYAMDAKLGVIDVMHDGKARKAYVVESFIARKGDPDFIEGAWVAGVYIADANLWDRVVKGELNGFSLDGLALRTEEKVELDMVCPLAVTCKTVMLKGDDHDHLVRVQLDDDGNIVGGETSFVNGHRHLVKRGTVTEEADDHKHKFDLLQAVLAEAA